MANQRNDEPLLIWPKKYNEVPKAVFEMEELWPKELNAIFYGEEWHPIVHHAEIPNPGDYKAAELGEMPIFAVHGEDGEIRVFQNTCTHRGTALITECSGNKKEFECPYHRWLFSPQGELVGCPNSQEFTADFDKKDFSLHQLRSEEFCGLHWVTMSDKTPPLKDYLGESFYEPLGRILGGDGRLKLIGYQKIMYNCNWKAYCDNDGYHAPLLHKAFALLNWQGGKGFQKVTENGHLAFESEIKVPDKVEALKDASVLDFKGTDTSSGSIVLMSFPLTVFSKHMDMLNVRYAFPRGPKGTEVHYAYFTHEDDDDEMIRHRIRQSSNLLGPCGLVSMEDASVFSRIDKGNKTPGNAIFQKGVEDEYKLSFTVKQNDESGNLPRWEHYRKIMGFEREK
ncbi:MAG: aromatic ring-hydroxylating dioxygenase subunit alpha [Gammaproteobacteria bacterium]|nr:aromatic ring-hydroxylating dioxygenase subunit alpha [Gammaproteobacteria bacterium]